ncbi:hypothetical protein BH23VER1_BH23VER1_13780 [soil metagenome]
MSLRLEMLQVARLGPSVLGTSATELVRAFLRSQADSSGGFLDRDGQPDLYYTAFAADALTALQAPLPPALASYLAGHAPESLDFVHACCLARLLSHPGMPADLAPAALVRIESFRTPDGGYNQTAAAPSGSAYAALLAYGAYADHHRAVPHPDALSAAVVSLADRETGGYVNDPDLPIPNAPATAAAVALSRNLRAPVAGGAADFLLSCFHPATGGFLPFPGAPLPDLLSTAVALHALDGLQIPFDQIATPTLDFIDTLWSAEGGFHCNWTDDSLDCEYTYYGLLALGHLAL